MHAVLLVLVVGRWTKIQDVQVVVQCCAFDDPLAFDHLYTVCLEDRLKMQHMLL